MNPAYKETFSRHKILFSLPIVLTSIIALMFVLGAPKVYEAQAALFVDNPPPGTSSLDQNNPNILSPAAQAQAFLTELLATRGFRLAVGEHGGLKKYLASHSSSGLSLSGLLHGQQPLDNRVVSALDAKHVVATVAGGQILLLSLKGPAPAVAANTLTALIDQLDHARIRLDVSRANESVSVYQGRVAAANALLAGATTPQAAAVYSQQLKSATKGLNEWRLLLAAAKAESTTFVVKDAPTPPTGPVSGKKKALMGLVGGLFVGALLSFLGIVLLSGREQRRVVEPPAEAPPAEAPPVEEPAVVQEEPDHEPSYGSNVEWLPTNSGLEYHAPGNGSNGSNGSHDGSREVEKPASHADQGRD